MAFFRLTASTVGVMMLFALVKGFTPGPKPGCNAAKIDAGYPYEPHEKYAELFYHCNAGLAQFTQACGPGTLYSTETSVCVAPEQTVNSNWQCSASTVGAKFPAMCCNAYYECLSSGFRRSECGSGQVFDSVSENCVNDNSRCVDHELCARSGTSSGNTWECYDFTDETGDPCKYTTKFGTIEYKGRLCPEGAEFNQTACQCSILNPLCLTSKTLKQFKEMDPECRATMRLDFSSLPLKVFTDRMADGLMPYHVRLFGTSLGNSEAILRPDPVTGGQPYLYIYYFNQNQYVTPVGFAATFRVNSDVTGSNTFTLLSNNYNNVCAPTLEVNVTVNSNSVQVNAFAIGATNTVASVARISGTATGSLNVNRGNYVEVVVYFDGALRGRIFDRGSGGGNRGNSADLTPSSALGEYIAMNKCGLVIARGLNGVLRKFNAYEGCGNTSKL